MPPGRAQVGDHQHREQHADLTEAEVSRSGWVPSAAASTSAVGSSGGVGRAALHQPGGPEHDAGAPEHPEQAERHSPSGRASSAAKGG